jgi:phage terminase large subunit-like protein
VRRVACNSYPADDTGWHQPKLDHLSRPHSCVVWCIAPTWQMVRDGIQSRLLGDVASGQIGTGLIPAEDIIAVQNARGISGAVDTVVVKRKGLKTTAAIRFKTYHQGREALQSESVDYILCDELPTDLGLWHELQARLSATNGKIWLTATPMKQMSPIVQWFKEPGHPERQTIVMTIDDADHLADKRAEMIARYQNNAAEAATRLWAADFSGGGRIFQTPMFAYVESRHDVTPVWSRWIIGLDPGHGGLSESASATGVVLCWWDDMNRTLHVHDCLRLKNALPETVVSSIMAWEWGDAPVAFGAAEHQGVSGSSVAETYAQHFKKLGLRMLDRHATLDGGTALEPQLDVIESALAGGKLRIARNCRDLLEEMQNYERDENGKPIAVRNDLIDAMRYAWLMAAKHSRALDPDRVRHRMGQRRKQGPRQAIGVEFDVHNPGSSDSERRGLNAFDSEMSRGPRQARDVDDFDW